jgi:hypothetical protein
MLTNHGNIDLQTLPTPDNVKPLYVSPQGAMYVSEASVAAATEEVRKLFLSLGWEPYGGAPECLDFRKNAVLLTARISSAPAQEGKTVIDYHTVLLAHDFPLPPDAVGIQYSNTPAQVLFDVKVSQEELAKFYRETLTKSGWKATTDNLVTVDRKQLQIFRNEQKDLMELEMTTVDDLTRAELHFQSAAEVEAEEKAFQAEKAKRLAEANKPKPTFKFSLPADAKNVEAEKTRVKFNLPVGTALATTEALKKQFEADGWKAEIAKLEAMFGVLELKKGEQTLTLNFLETGILAPEVTISSFGVDLEVAAIK